MALWVQRPNAWGAYQASTRDLFFIGRVPFRLYRTDQRFGEQ